MKIAIVVHGRFHAFDLARELINLGHDVTLFTNYPKYIVKKWGIPAKNVESFLIHGIVSKAASWLNEKLKFPYPEPFLHKWFSTWARKGILKKDYDVVRVFSGVAEEIFKALVNKKALKILTRGSAHILFQHKLLLEEEERAGVFIDKPKRWGINRELREYELADSIQVLSTFAQKSFLMHGIAKDRLSLLLSSTQVERFRPDKKVIDERCGRILSGKPLRILMVGTFSFRKGILDFCKIVSLTGEAFRFRFVGRISKEAYGAARGYKDKIEFIPRKFEFELPKFYNWADIFIFPTIEDSFPVVLAQAQAAGLPIASSANCCAPDIIEEGRSGWVLPIRSPGAFAERLAWCDAHRSALSKMALSIYENFKPRGWPEVAKDFIDMTNEILNKHTRANGSQGRGL
ncbi:MAG: glycosyltransferase family 4 protein [Candidatus Omnitrophota bacterium]